MILLRICVALWWLGIAALVIRGLVLALHEDRDVLDEEVSE